MPLLLLVGPLIKRDFLVKIREKLGGPSLSWNFLLHGSLGAYLLYKNNFLYRESPTLCLVLIHLIGDAWIRGEDLTEEVRKFLPAGEIAKEELNAHFRDILLFILALKSYEEFGEFPQWLTLDSYGLTGPTREVGRVDQLKIVLTQLLTKRAYVVMRKRTKERIEKILERAERASLKETIRELKDWTNKAYK